MNSDDLNAKLYLFFLYLGLRAEMVSPCKKVTMTKCMPQARFYVIDYPSVMIDGHCGTKSAKEANWLQGPALLQ